MKSPQFSPSYDNKIFRKFSVRTLESKIDNKLSLQTELGWVTEPKCPLLCIPSGMSERQGGSIFQSILPGILSLNCQLLVRGIGSDEYGSLFAKLEKQHPHRIRILRDEDGVRRQMYAAADLSLHFAEDPVEVANCLAYGTIPVSPAQNELIDYNPIEESGNAFLADPMNTWKWFAALIRAIETYKLPYDWRTIQKHAMLTVKEEIAIQNA